MKLRSYQREILDETKNKTGAKAPLLVLPTVQVKLLSSNWKKGFCRKLLIDYYP